MSRLSISAWQEINGLFAYDVCDETGDVLDMQGGYPTKQAALDAANASRDKLKFGVIK